MASKRNVRRRACERKRRYPTKEQAYYFCWETAEHNLRCSGRTDQRIHAYRCHHCGGWHVGHNPKATEAAGQFLGLV